VLLINQLCIHLILLGSVLPDEYAAVGTGAEMALRVLDPQFKPNMTKDEAINLANMQFVQPHLEILQVVMGWDVLVITKDGTEIY